MHGRWANEKPEHRKHLLQHTQADVLKRNVARMTACLLLRSYLSQRLPQSADELISLIFFFLLSWLVGFGFNATGRKGLSGGIPMAHFLMLSPLAIGENKVLQLVSTVAAS